MRICYASFSQNVLQKEMLREIDVYDFVVAGHSAIVAVGPSALVARLQRNTYKSTYSGIQKWRQNYDFQ